jgi:hypothetical protein
MRFRSFSLLMSFILPAALAWADALPRELVGVWATADSEFDGENLIGGQALYLSPEGRAALVGAPLPVHRCEDGRVCTPKIGVGGNVTYESASARLTMNLHSGIQKLSVNIDHRASDGTLLLHAPAGFLLMRKSVTLPDAAARELNGEP